MLLACRFFIGKCSTWRSSQSVNNQSELSKILRPGHGCLLYSFLELKHLSLLLSFLFGVPFGVPSFTFLGSWKSHRGKVLPKAQGAMINQVFLFALKKTTCE